MRMTSKIEQSRKAEDDEPAWKPETAHRTV
jgi:hypothetical protein